MANAHLAELCATRVKSRHTNSRQLRNFGRIGITVNHRWHARSRIVQVIGAVVGRLLQCRLSVGELDIFARFIREGLGRMPRLGIAIFLVVGGVAAQDFDRA